MPAADILPSALWQGIAFDWLWVYHGTAPRVRDWSHEITVPTGVFFVESGRAIIRAGRQEIEVPAGHTFFTAPGSRRQWFEENTRMLSVGLRCQWPDGLPLYSAGLNMALPTRQLKKLHEATQALFTTVHGRRKQVTYAEGVADKNHSLETWSQHEAAFRQWFAEYADTLKRKGISPTPRLSAGDRRLKQLRHWLQAWPLDRKLAFDDIARTVDLSPRRIHELLKQDLGMTAQVYLEKRRLEQARLRLIHEDTALKEIAFALGFRHPPHFTAWFRRHTGMTPTAYRQGHGMEGA